MIRIGIVGCGRILAAHLRGYQLLREAGVNDFRITALCARREEDARMYVKRGAGPPQRKPVSNAAGDPLAIGDVYLSDFQDDVEAVVYTDYRQMIAAAPIDAVNDYTVHSLHHLVAAEAFAHGKHLLTQKPLAATIAAGRRMCDEAENRSLVLGVFENARNRVPTRQIRWLLDSGRFGRLQMTSLLNLGNWWTPNLVVAETPWRHLREEGGGITLDIGVHWFDVFRYLAGEIKSVTAQTAVVEPRRVIRDDSGRVTEEIECNADDYASWTFEAEQGVLGNVTIGWCGRGQSAGPLAVFYTTSGGLAGDTLTSEDGKIQSLAGVYRQHVKSDWHDRHFPFGLEDGFALNQHDWLEAIRQKREPETSGREGLRDMAAAFAVLESSHSGRRVEVQDVYEGRVRDFQAPLDKRLGLMQAATVRS